MTLSDNECGQVKLFRKQLRNTHIRGVILISGDKHWVEQYSINLLSVLDKNCLWIGDGSPDEIDSDIATNAKHYLGQDLNTIIVNCYCGFHPDGFGALAGMLAGGGLLVLLSPSIAIWPTFKDPDYQRITAHNTVVTSYNFIHRVIARLTSNENLWHIEQGKTAVSFPTINAPAFTQNPDFVLTDDQKIAFNAIKKTAYGRSKRPLVITSDRGRGKSSVLGLAAADLLKANFTSIAICAPRRSAVNAVFDHASKGLANFTLKENSLKNEQKKLFFIPPDELVLLKPSAEIVLVDEAAAIPASVLKKILLHYPRVVFATTVHGYEGNGRGFAIRFAQTLDEMRPQWRRVFLRQPVRWAEDDYLEPLVSDLLLLNATESKIVKPFDRAKVKLKFVSGAELVINTTMLTELFGLLVQAHYRTSPDDLRLMLDGPNIIVAIAVCNNAVVGAVLVSSEGAIEHSLHQPIEQGNRRVSGHLAPQILAAQAGMQDILDLSCWRIMRIAVHPEARRCGIGGLLLTAIFNKAKLAQQDYLATSFAATTEVFDFWQASRFSLQHIGWRRDSVSGAHTTLMVRPISTASHSLCNKQLEKLTLQLPILLCDSLSELEADIVVKLIKNLSSTTKSLNADDRRDIKLFVAYQRSYETCITALSNSALLLIASLDDHKVCQLIVYKVLQHNSWHQVATQFGYSGKAEVVSILKQAYQSLL